MLSLDTNILVCATDQSAGERHRAAHRLVSAAVRIPAAVTEQSLVELLNATTRRMRLPMAEAIKVVRGYMRWFQLLVPHDDVLEDTIALLEHHLLQVWDARLLAVCGAHGCDYLISEDLQDGATYGGVRIVNPFDPKNSTLLQELFA